MKPWACLSAALCAWPALAQVPAEPAAAPQPEWVQFGGALSIKTGSSPRLRLEQDTSAGRPARIWDLGGDDRELFLIDLTAFTMPVRIDAGGGWESRRMRIQGGTEYLYDDEAAFLGNVGLGPASTPEVALQFENLDPAHELRLLVEEASPLPAARNLVRLFNNGPSTLAFQDTPSPLWFTGSMSSGDFGIVTAGGGTAFQLTPSGNLTIAGVLTQLSDRNAKQDLEGVDREDLLARLAALPLSTWRYQGDSARHIGPMAQDFAAAFGLGADDRHVAPSDLAGVGLAAVQALHAQAGGLERQLGRSGERLAAQDARRARLEAALELLEGAAGAQRR